MKLGIIKKALVISAIGCITPVGCLSSISCGNPETEKDVIGSLDGTDWQGVKEGYYFQESDYVINDEEQTVTYIGSDQFASGEYLRIPDYVKHNDKNYKVIIGEKCFMDASWIEGVVELNKFTDSIPVSCFESNTRTMSIKGIIMNNYPKTIGEAAFRDCMELDTFYVRHNGILDKNWAQKIETIGAGAFARCSLSFGDPTFGNPLIFGETLQQLGNECFEGCNLSYVSLSFSDKLTQIPDSAFHDCKLMTRFDMGKNINTIGVDAFNSCDELKIINLPKDNMKFTISEGTFANCKSLEKFSRVCYFDSFPKTCFLQCSSLEAQPWSFPFSEEWRPVIGESAFEGCNFSYIKFVSGTPRPAKKAFAAYKQTVRAGEGMVIDFTDYTPEGSTNPIPPDPIWLPQDGTAEVPIPWEENEYIFYDKPDTGRIRFKGTSTTCLDEKWDKVFETLGFDKDKDFGPDKWMIEFVE